MYVAAGAAAEAVTGQTWESLLRERVLQPMNMTRTWPSIAEVPASENASVAKPYRQRKHVVQFDLAPSNPAGSIVSNVDDMLVWCNEFTKALQGSSQLLTRQFAAQFVQANSISPYFESRKGTYTLGWRCVPVLF